MDRSFAAVQTLAFHLLTEDPKEQNNLPLEVNILRRRSRDVYEFEAVHCVGVDFGYDEYSGATEADEVMDTRCASINVRYGNIRWGDASY